MKPSSANDWTLLYQACGVNQPRPVKFAVWLVDAVSAIGINKIVERARIAELPAGKNCSRFHVNVQG
jgi:hypothetical protein